MEPYLMISATYASSGSALPVNSYVYAQKIRIDELLGGFVSFSASLLLEEIFELLHSALSRESALR